MQWKHVLASAGTGAALAFMLDPASGRRRRALVRDKVTMANRKTRSGMDALARDVRNRTAGIVAATRRRSRRQDVDDARLLERVRSQLGRVCSHPRAIDVHVWDGVVTLRGPVLAMEVNTIMSAVAGVSGVRQAVDNMESHASAERIPALQGDGRASRPWLDLLQRRWATSTRALVGTGAIAAAAGVTTLMRRRPRHASTMVS